LRCSLFFAGAICITKAVLKIIRFTIIHYLFQIAMSAGTPVGRGLSLLPSYG
jgi:hypothetical protein